MSSGSSQKLISHYRPAEHGQSVQVVGQNPLPKVDARTIMPPHLAVQPRVLAASQAGGSFLSCPPSLQPPKPPKVLSHIFAVFLNQIQGNPPLHLAELVS